MQSDADPQAAMRITITDHELDGFVVVSAAVYFGLEWHTLTERLFGAAAERDAVVRGEVGNIVLAWQRSRASALVRRQSV